MQIPLHLYKLYRLLLLVCCCAGCWQLVAQTTVVTKGGDTPIRVFGDERIKIYGDLIHDQEAGAQGQAPAQLGVDDDSGNNQIIVTGSLENRASFNMFRGNAADKNHFIFGPVTANPVISGNGLINFYQMTNRQPNNSVLRLDNEIAIRKQLNMAQGKLNLNNQTLFLLRPTDLTEPPLANYPVIAGENNNDRIYSSQSAGNIQMNNVYALASGSPNTFNFGRMGLELNLNNALLNKTYDIQRTHNSETINVGAQKGIKRNFEVSWDGPATTTPFELSFHYLPDEVAEAGLSSADLQLFRLKDGETRWQAYSESDVATGGNPVTETVEAVTGTWTLSPCDNPPNLDNIPDLTELCKGETRQFVVNTPDVFSVSWSTGETTPTIDYTYENSDDPGMETIEVIVENNKGCRTKKVFAIERLITPEADLGADQTICDGATETLTPVAEDPADYNYTWSTGATSPMVDYTASAVGTESIWVEVRHATVSTCLDRDTIEFTVNPSPAPQFGGGELFLCDTEVTTLDAGDDGPSFQWYFYDPETDMEQAIDGATNATYDATTTGTYIVEVTNSFNCTTSADMYLFLSNLEAAIEVDTVNCFAGADGVLTAQPSGSGLDDYYEYSWANASGNPFSSDAMVFNLPAGNYNLTVTDGPCSIEQTVELPQPTPIVSSFEVTENINCDQPGQINFMPSGGTPGYTYFWSNGATSQDIPGLGVGDGGTYTVTVVDNNGCDHVNEVFVDAPEVLTLQSTELQNVTCNGEATGSFALQTEGGTAPFTFDIGDGAIDENEFSALSAGDYNVTVVDAGTCQTVLPVTIYEPESIQLEVVEVTDADCGMSNGSLNIVEVSGGEPGYSFLWLESGEEELLLENQPPGSYSVQVTDVLDCTVTFPLSIGNIDGPQIDDEATVVQDVTCFEAMDGQVVPVVTGENLDYSWSDGTTGTDLTNLGPGDYTLTLTDVETTCADVQVFSIMEPPALAFNEQIEDVPCNGEMNGRIDPSVSGGISDIYTYEWSNGLSDPVLENLDGGDYLLTVTDENGCTLEMIFVVEEPTAIEIMTDIPDLLCNGDIDGTIDIETTGGPAPANQHQYFWSTGVIDQDLSDLTAGAYDLTVTSGNCEAYATFEVEEPDAIVINEALEDATCFGLSNGSIVVTLTGGVGGFDVTWSNGVTSNANDGLSAGEYAVTVTDANDCVADASYEILEPEVLALKADVNGEACTEAGERDGWIRLMPEGGTPNYQYQWSNGETTAYIEELVSASYGVTITDQQDCRLERTFELPKAPEVFEVKFLAASKVKADSTIYFIDVSYPAPNQWLWQFGDRDNSISTEANPTFAYQNTPDELISFYDVTMKATTEFCVDSLTKTIEVENLRSSSPEPDTNIVVQNQFFREIKAFPNPTSGELVVEIVLSTEGQVDLQLLSMSGQQLRQFELLGRDNYLQRLDLGSLPSGMYVLLAQFKNDRRGLKIVVVDE